GARLFILAAPKRSLVGRGVAIRGRRFGGGNVGERAGSITKRHQRCVIPDAAAGDARGERRDPCGLSVCPALFVPGALGGWRECAIEAGKVLNAVDAKREYLFEGHREGDV